VARLLHIEASPRGAESFSARAAAAFVDEYRRSHPQDEIEQLRLFEHGSMPRPPRRRCSTSRN